MNAGTNITETTAAEDPDAKAFQARWWPNLAYPIEVLPKIEARIVSLGSGYQ